MKEMWNQRYSAGDYVYGKDPNSFFKKIIDSTSPGKLLLPAEGEGRNAVYAALKGWQVFAVDYSSEAKKKAELLALENGVSIAYEICDIENWKSTLRFDLIGLFYAHTNPSLRKSIHQNLSSHLQPGGKIILEAFNKNQLKNSSGGPKNLEMLFNKDMLQHDFEDLKISSLEEMKVMLDSGEFHQGEADLIQMIAQQNN